MKANKQVLNRKESLQKTEETLKRNSQIQYFASLFFFTISLIVFYLSTNLNIFTIGFGFDFFIAIGVVNIIFFLTKKDITRTWALTLIASITMMGYIADSMFYRSFKFLGSVADIANFRWLDFRGYGIGLNLVIVLMLCLVIAYIIIIHVYHNSHYIYKRKKIYLTGLIIFLPYVYTFFIGIQEYQNVNEYLNSKTYIFAEGLGKLLDQRLFLREFGYSIFRYEDINSVIVDTIKIIIRWFK